MKQLKKEDLEQFIGKDMYVIVTQDKEVFRINNQFQYFAAFETEPLQDYIFDLKGTLPGLSEHLQIMKYRIEGLWSFTDLCTKNFYPFIRIVGYGDLPLQEIVQYRDDIVEMLTNYLHDNIKQGLPAFYLAGANKTYIHETIDGIEMNLSFYTTVKKAQNSFELKPSVYSLYARQLDKLNPYGFYSINSKMIYGIEILGALAAARKMISEELEEETAEKEEDDAE
ncbi:MAG: hypothetical protein IKF80_08045 [Erysipelotrichaceae bacterium]|nr:hypothetical protein [Erysipelotrichaceae bacterium]